jgi:CPA2 family monovalent cation:H+ antiporter-2
LSELYILTDLLIVFALGVGVVLLFHAARLPPVAGFLVAGVLAGPQGLELVTRGHEIEVLAEIGVVLLLFSIGIEFSVERLVRLRRFVLLGGTLQVGLTLGLVVAASRGFGVDWGRAVVLGMAAALSSTAVVARLIAERGELDTPHGRASLGILIFQDLCIVPMMFAVPWLAGRGAGLAELGWTGAKALGFLVAALAASRYGVPWALRLAVATRRREVFVLAVILLCLGAAWASAQAGLSLALGAFVAGLILSDSEYGFQAFGDVMPLREVFSSLFFLSVGLMLDFRGIAAAPVLFLVGVAGVLALKAGVVTAVVLGSGYPLRVAAASGLALAQVGEFAFLLAQAGARQGIVDGAVHQGIVATAGVTMALTPGLFALATRVTESRHPAFGWQVPWRRDRKGSDDGTEPLADHVVVIGYGLNGRNLARVLDRVGIRHVIVELNPDTVREERSRGAPILFGDATTRETLTHAAVPTARAVVVAISDPASTRNIAALTHQLNPQAKLIVRTRYVQEVEPILKLGATDVIPEEFETSIEIFARVLHEYLVSKDEIERCVRAVRVGAYQPLRGATPESAGEPPVEYLLTGLDFQVFRLAPGCRLEGVTLEASRLRSRTGVTVVAILRRDGGELVPNPPAGTAMEPGDLALVLGAPEAVRSARMWFNPPRCRRRERRLT